MFTSAPYIVIIQYIIVLIVLKKNYQRLHQCLPQDYSKTIERLKNLNIKFSDEELSILYSLRSNNLINEAIISKLLTYLYSDSKVLFFCDILQLLVEGKASNDLVNKIRNG